MPLPLALLPPVIEPPAFISCPSSVTMQRRFPLAFDIRTAAARDSATTVLPSRFRNICSYLLSNSASSLGDADEARVVDRRVAHHAAADGINGQECRPSGVHALQKLYRAAAVVLGVDDYILRRGAQRRLYCEGALIVRADKICGGGREPRAGCRAASHALSS